MLVTGFRSVGLVAAAVLVATLVCASPAAAGSYKVSACIQAPGGVNNSWTAQNGATDGYSMPVRCDGVWGPDAPAVSSVSGLAVVPILGLNGSQVGNKDAHWRFTAPAGTTITRADIGLFMGKVIEQTWRPYVRTGAGTTLATCDWGLGQFYCQVGSPGGGAQVFSGLSTSELRVGLACSVTNCGGGLSLYSGWAAINGAEVWLSESTLPQVGSVSGSAFTAAPGWVSGTVSAQVSASDDVAVQRVQLLVDGTVVDQYDAACDFTFAVPCPASAPRLFSFSTTGLSDGDHQVTVRVTDAASNTFESGAHVLFVDNTPPVWFGASASVQGSAAQVSYSFTGGGSPIDTVRWQLCDSQGASCGAEQSATQDPFSVPVPVGVSTVRVRGIDRAGHSSDERLVEITRAADPTNGGGGGSGPPVGSDPSRNLGGGLVPNTQTTTTTRPSGGSSQPTTPTRPSSRCRSGYVRWSKSGKCVKKCRKTETRSKVTGRCRKKTTARR